MPRLLTAHSRSNNLRFAVQIICATLLLTLSFGCNQGSSLDRKILEGNVVCGGKKVAAGNVRFVPIAGTKGPVTVAPIIDGRYRATNRGGVPFGQHRVEIIAQRPTGEMIDLGDGQLTKKLEQIGDKKYAGKGSPLRVEVNADSKDRMDFDIPAS
ncbi:MAG: hypothetical protein JW959_14785 [Pirellulales bacterium]|nr:hypothetical protein [Pirellulales bacterium]